MSWNAFGRELDEAAVLGNADALVRSGLRDAGYDYVCLDDHWHGGRGMDGRLRPDPVRFPMGIRGLADELHAQGLRLGIYTCAGRLTCGGEPGSEGSEEVDAATFAEWGVDYVKDDYCHAPPDRDAAIERYRRMGSALATSGRPMVFAICEWGQRAPWEWAPSVHAQLWRTSDDIQDAWAGTGGILAVADATEPLAAFARPGAWNDPDMLVAGLRGKSRPGAAGTIGCNDAEYRTQVSLWSMLAAPLLASCDLRTADVATLDILRAPGVLAIDQDRLGRAARRIGQRGTLDLWQRPLTGGATAVAVINRANRPVSVRLRWIHRHGALPGVVDAWTEGPMSAPPQTVELEPHATALYRVALEAPDGEPVVQLGG